MEAGGAMSEQGPAPSAGAAILDGRAVAAQVRAEVAQRVRRLRERTGITPGLAFVLVGDDPSSLSYIRSKGEAATEAGIHSITLHLPAETPQAEVIARVRELNADPAFHAILVQLPLPPHIDEGAVMEAIDPAKDVDGVTAVNMGRLLRGEPCPQPCTPRGVVELLLRTGHRPEGKHVVIVGRSNIVGKPLAAILVQKRAGANATVTVCHTGTPDLARFTRQADILVAAMGSPLAITADMVRPGAVVVDVGNNWLPDPSRKSGRRLVGDVDYQAVRQVAGAITPVPGGVGPMTVAMVLLNTLELAEGQLGLA